MIAVPREGLAGTIEDSVSYRCAHTGPVEPSLASGCPDCRLLAEEAADAVLAWLAQAEPKGDPAPAAGMEAVERQVSELRRAHRMSCSDPSDPTRRTTYGDAADTIEALMGRVRDLEAARGR